MAALQPPCTVLTTLSLSHMDPQQTPQHNSAGTAAGDGGQAKPVMALMNTGPYQGHKRVWLSQPGRVVPREGLLGTSRQHVHSILQFIEGLEEVW